MLDKILGSQTAALILLHVYHHGEAYPSATAKDMDKSLGQVQRQYDRLEQAGVFVSKLLGKTRVYTFNEKSPYARKLKELVNLFYTSISQSEREKMLAKRRRPRRKGKPVIT
jgi:DNA-binding MarR family transcriptional regulator